MRRLATATSPPPIAAARLHLWKSPIPYLFGGLSLTMLLIAGALIILACSFRKRFTGNSSAGSQKDPPAAGSAALELIMEPKILVIMAGDDMPTFMATPAGATVAPGPRCCSCSANQQDGNQNHAPS